MTPPATTPAGRRRAAKRTTGAPAAPRRVSGPVGGRSASGRVPRGGRPSASATANAATATATATAGAATAPTFAPPRRRTRQRPEPRRRTAPRRVRVSGRGLATGLAIRTKTFVRGLPNHSLLDRAIRGRAWIPILGVMLAGIVAMQVEVLKLGASMGRSIDQGTALQSRNELLRASVASLADDQRIERLAAGMGMVMPAPEEVGFLAKHSGDAARAARNIHTPDATAFLTSLQALIPPSPTTGTTSTSTSTSTGAVAPATTLTDPASTVSPTAATSSSVTSVAATPPSTSSTGSTPVTGG